MKRLLVIGGGLAGLSAAWAARKAGADVRVLELDASPGGVVQSVNEQGFLVETGPNTLTTSNPAFLNLIGELGLEKEITATAPAARARYIVRNGKLVAVPMSPLAAITTPLLSWSAKLRLLREPFIPARSNVAAGDESLAEFARRRLGAEVYAYALEPMVAGIFAGNPEKLAVRHVFPRLHKMEADHGSIARGMFRTQRTRRPKGTPSLISFREGMAALPRALAAKLGGSLISQARLVSLERRSEGTWFASWQSPAGHWQEQFDAVVLAVPAHALATLPLPAELAVQLAPLATIEHPPVTNVVVGFSRRDVGHPLDGFGVLVPAVEKFSILGALFNSTLFSGRAPVGQVLITVFVGGARQPELAVLPDAELLARVLADLGKLLQVTAPPTFQKIIRWPHAIPQYHLNYGIMLATMEAAERAWPGLILTGSYRGGVAVPQVLENGAIAGLRALNLSPSTGE